MCPKCKSDSNNEHVKKPGDGLPNPSAIALMGLHANSILKIESQMHQSKGVELKELQRRLRMETAELESATQKSSLPNLYCVKCNEQCLPRDMSVMGANKCEAFPCRVFGSFRYPRLPSKQAQPRGAEGGLSMINDAEWYEQQRNARREALNHWGVKLTRELYGNQQDDASMAQCSSD